MYKIKLKTFIPGVAWFFVVLFLMCLPGKDLPPTDWLHLNYVDKWLHTGVFTVMVFLFCWPLYRSGINEKLRRYYFIKISSVTVIWGFVIELIQKFFIPGRSFDLLDWVADSVGAILGFYISSYLFIKCDKTVVKQ